jgi:DNA-binding transcriptional LysR family regulator
MGVSLLPASVLHTFAEKHRLRIYPLPSGHNRVRTLLTWRKGAGSPKIGALLRILGKSMQNRKEAAP